MSLHSLAMLADALGAVHVLVSEPMREIDHAAVAKTLDTGKAVGPSISQWIERQVDLLSRLDDLFGGTQLVELVEIDIALITDAAQKTRDPSLLRGLSQLHRLAGWTCHDSLEYEKATTHYEKAIDLSRETGDTEHSAHVMAMMAFVCTRQDRPQAALEWLRRAEHEAAPGSAVRVLTSMLAVHPLEQLRHHNASRRMLDTADTLFDVTTMPSELYWIALAPSYRAMVAESFVANDPKLAIKMLIQGMGRGPSEYARDQLYYRIGLAEAYQSTGELDASVSEALLAVPNARYAPRISRRLDALCARMPKDPVTKPLFEALQES